MSQLPPCSRGGTVGHASAAAVCAVRPVICPINAVGACGGASNGGTRSGLVASSSASRRFARLRIVVDEKSAAVLLGKDTGEPPGRIREITDVEKVHDHQVTGFGSVDP